MRTMLLVVAAIGFLVESSLASPGDLLTTFVNPTPDYTRCDYFGHSIAGQGSQVIVGAYWDDTGTPATRDGAVHLFDIATGSLVRTMPGVIASNSGYSVAFMGSHIVSGAILADRHPNPPLDYGAVYKYDSATGAHVLTFQNPAPQAAAHFGEHMAVVGGNLLVGMPYDDAAGTNAGRAYLFDGTTGTLLHTFYAPVPTDYDRFGSGVAALGNDVLIGSPGRNGSAGIAYLFDSTTGNLLQTFQKPEPNAWDSFGSSVASVGDKVLVAAPGADAGADGTGAAYLFDSGTGELLATFLNPDPDAYDGFGYFIAGVGDDVLIGAPYDDTHGDHAGAAYLFDGDTGSLLLSLQDPTPGADDFFGAAVASLGNDILVSAYGDNAGVGAVYVFEGVPIPEPTALSLVALVALGLLVRRRA